MTFFLLYKSPIESIELLPSVARSQDGCQSGGRLWEYFCSLKVISGKQSLVTSFQGQESLAGSQTRLDILDHRPEVDEQLETGGTTKFWRIEDLLIYSSSMFLCRESVCHTTGLQQK